MYLFLYFLGNLKRIDTRLQLHGVGLSTSVYDRSRSLIHPFTCSIDLETIWAPHSRDLYVQRYVMVYVPHNSLFVFFFVYSCAEESYMYLRVSSLAQEHNAMTPVSTRTRIPGVQSER